ncbi:MAG: hypothetical protein H6502_02020 [Candidatus Woesearchaeota archaeon]|nr:MAG: hypothetical protein H6502_02020 [Candidatus Woesearchaeota archaeon]
MDPRIITGILLSIILVLGLLFILNKYDVLSRDATETGQCGNVPNTFCVEESSPGITLNVGGCSDGFKCIAKES